MRATDTFGVQTDEDHLRALRRELVNARQLLYAIDEGDTFDGHFECDINGDGMHPRVRNMLECLDSVIRETAYMLDELETKSV
jgi:hypothetical protein